MPEPVKTTCPYCGVGCGLLVSAADDGGYKVAGDPDHPANLGRLCSKGAALGDTLDLDGRLLHPEIGTQRVNWDHAIAAVARGFGNIIRDHGPDAVAFYVSGQLLTEDYYVANKLMKGFIGSGNIDTNSRLCMSSAVVGHKRAFGADFVPVSYEDLEQAELIVLVGSNLAWCHPVIFQRIKAAKVANPGRKVVVIDPRHTPTCDIADLHLAIKPGTDVALFNGLLNQLRQQDAIDWPFLEEHTEGFGAAMTAAKADPGTLPDIAAHCDLPAGDLARFIQLFISTEKTVTVFSQGVNQSSQGSDKVNAIINCHLATGRIGKAGMGPLSITGQPNAMGGREVGGLANTLAAHMDFAPADVDRVARFWDAARMAEAPGLKAVDLFRAIEDGTVKAVWIMATNPVVSLPDADRVRTALKKCELVVVSDCIANTDTARLAHIRLPAAAWGEKDGTVTNSERRISRQRAFLERPGEAKGDWWIVTQVARAMGFEDGFPYRNVAEVFREHAALSAFENKGSRDFDIGALGQLDDPGYDRLEPVRWPQSTNADRADARTFYTPSGKARMVAVRVQPPAHAPDEDYPLVLNTGRIRDQWHTMTRTAKAPKLNAHRPEPYLVVHPADARRWALLDGHLAQVESRWGDALLRIVTSDEQRPGEVFSPIHWNGQTAARARIGALVNPVTDPHSGEPEFKHTPVRVKPFRAVWHGFVLSHRPLESLDTAFWSVARGNRFWRYELAGLEHPEDWPAFARALLASPAYPPGDPLEFFDPASKRFRHALIADNRIQACLFAGPTPHLPSRTWLASLFTKDALDPTDRMSLLAGRPSDPAADAGETVCSCFGVGRNTLIKAIREQGADTPEALGERLQAGTNCGSCIPELRELIASQSSSDAA
ncbi:MAG: molybdopterin-dependent oxidoreductase [Gammaproteobacteria bacterium]